MLPTEITWVVCEGARATAATLKSELGDARYDAMKNGLKAFICGYFSAVVDGGLNPPDSGGLRWL